MPSGMLDPRILLLNGGRVTSRDPSLVRKGGLRRAEGVEYLHDNPAIRTIPGRAKFNAAAEEGTIKGLRWLQFDAAPGGEVLIAAVGSVYRKAITGLTGVFADFVTGLSGGPTLDSVYLGGVHVLMNGVDRNRVISADGTVRTQGMLDNTAAPTVTYETGVGFTLTSGFTIDYWFEERVKDSVGTIIKRNSGSKFLRITGDGTQKKPTLTHTLVNSDATHLALYGTKTNVQWPVGAEIAEVPIATLAIADTRTGTDPSTPSGAIYETVSVTLRGLATVVPKWGQPPISTTADVLEESIVQNDVANPTLLVFTDYRNIHAVPSVNVFAPGNTKYGDTVRLVRTINRSLIVCLADSVRVIESLPRQTNAAFEPERLGRQIQAKHGCVGAMAGDTLDIADAGTFLAYVSPYGIHITNGGPEGEPVSGDMDWENEVDVGSLATSILINDPARYQLHFFHNTPAGQRVETLLHYHSSHLINDEGGLKFKVSGPYPLDAQAAVIVPIAGRRRLFTGHGDGTVYVAGEGTTDASKSDGKIPFAVETAEVYSGGVLHEARQRRIGVHHQAAEGKTVHVSAFSRKEGEADTVPVFRVEKDISKRQLTKLYRGVLGESIILKVDGDGSGTPVQIDYAVLGTSTVGTAD